MSDGDPAREERDPQGMISGLRRRAWRFLAINPEGRVYASGRWDAAMLVCGILMVVGNAVSAAYGGAGLGPAFRWSLAVVGLAVTLTALSDLLFVRGGLRRASGSVGAPVGGPGELLWRHLVVGVGGGERRRGGPLRAGVRPRGRGALLLVQVGTRGRPARRFQGRGPLILRFGPGRPVPVTLRLDEEPRTRRTFSTPALLIAWARR